MTNEQIMAIAMAQSAIDCNCSPEDFRAEGNRVVVSAASDRARKYLNLPFACNLVSYGHNVVASVRVDLVDLARGYIDRFPAEHCFETPNLHVLDAGLEAFGLRVCFMAEYFLPDVRCVAPLPCAYPLKVLTQADFEGLYLPQWGNALCERRRQLDVLGVGAYDGGRLVGLAGCSADCDTMWQIGVDVLPEYRRQGLAGALTSRLAVEILSRGQVPFYCAAWSNIGSVRNAIKSGFRPAWAEMTARPVAFVAELNR